LLLIRLPSINENDFANETWGGKLGQSPHFVICGKQPREMEVTCYIISCWQNNHIFLLPKPSGIMARFLKD
jgi:hypothetical protein